MSKNLIKRKKLQMHHMHSEENKPMSWCLDAGSCFLVQSNDTEIKTSVMAGLLEAESSKHPQLLFIKNRLPLKIGKSQWCRGLYALWCHSLLNTTNLVIKNN